MTTQAHSARDRDIYELRHECEQLVPGTGYVAVTLPREAIRLLADLARAEWDRRQGENQAHRVSVATGGQS